MSPKSSLGQNFLKNPGIVDKIIRFADLQEHETVLEIGPGKGALTGRLLGEAARVIAVEKDDALYEDLQERFGDNPRLILIHGDILEVDLSGLISPGTKVVANLPYNIATQVILRLSTLSGSLSAIVVMVQKEVGERICAQVGGSAYSAMSVLLAPFFDPVPGFLVGPNNFHPVPKVDSMVLKLLPRKDTISAAEIDDFRKVVLGAFGQRRKMLRNSLMSIPGVSRDVLESMAGFAEISLNRRPQDLSWVNFQDLARAYKKFTCPE